MASILGVGACDSVKFLKWNWGEIDTGIRVDADIKVNDIVRFRAQFSESAVDGFVWKWKRKTKQVIILSRVC